MRKSRSILTLVLWLYSIVAYSQNLFLQENALIHISEEAELQVGGELENNGLIQNNGTLSLFGDLRNKSMLNSLTGTLSFLGAEDQVFTSPDFYVFAIKIDGLSNSVMLNSKEIRVTGSIDFIDGKLSVPDTSELIIEADARTLGGNENSYFDGALTQLGTGFKYYPIGNNGLFTPINLEDVRGVDVRMRVSSSVPNEPAPVPADDVVGVSEHALWKIQLVGGTLDSALISLEYNNADLENFTNRNEINADRISPVVVVKNTPEDVFRSLGIAETFTDTDITSPSGFITAEKYIAPGLENDRLIGLGLAPLLPPEGSFYIPNAFSPNAIDEENKTFKVYGVKVLRQDFMLRIFNRSNVLVYETDDYTEANQVGWNGQNRNTGNAEPSGLYYYTISYRLEDGILREEQNAIYLIR